jgi:hypothetical protein
VTIPERVPVGDPLHGYIIQVSGVQALAAEPFAQTEILAGGDFIIRYGLRYLGKLDVSIVPGLVVMDYGDMLTGEAAWEFLLTRSNLYPRSEVVGYRNNGQEDMVFIRSLDMAVQPQVLVYENAEATIPLASPVALISTDTAGLPERLVKSIAVYPSVDDWQTTTSNE